MNAKSRERQIQLYGLDLLWLLAKRYYDNLPRPSEIAGEENKNAGPTAAEIKENIVRKLGGADA